MINARGEGGLEEYARSGSGGWLEECGRLNMNTTRNDEGGKGEEKRYNLGGVICCQHFVHLLLLPLVPASHFGESSGCSNEFCDGLDAFESA